MSAQNVLSNSETQNQTNKKKILRDTCIIDKTDLKTNMFILL